MEKITLSIIFSIFLLSSFVNSENPKQECILKSIVNSFGLKQEHLDQLIINMKIRDFNSDPVINESNLLEQLELEDASTYSDIQFLLTSPDFMSLMQPMISTCKLNVSRTKRRCEKVFGDGNCVALTPFVFGKKCDPGYDSEGVGFCVPKCPKGFDDVSDDPFVCSKASPIQRSVDLIKVDDNRHLLYSYHRNIKFLTCPDGFASWGMDFCIQKCPLGYTDLGKYCQKPLIQRREFELFIYDVSVDDFLVVETHEVQY